MKQVAALIAEALNGVQSGAQVNEKLLAVRRRVTELADRFPLYPWKLSRATA
jgi:glycine/serine hydroxymethyltransferase